MISCYYLKSGQIIIGKENEENIEDVLTIRAKLVPINQITFDMKFECFPLGYPINKKSVIILKQDLQILFKIEIKDELVKAYEEGFQQLNTDLITPKKSSLII